MTANLFRSICQCSLITVSLWLVGCSTPTTRPDQVKNGPWLGESYMPDQISDPYEPVNRGVWAFNRGLMKTVVSPAGRGYRAVVPARVRESIRNFGYNLGYPGRALNEVLQGRMGDAGDESVRFLCNTTAGGLGFFDVASRCDIPKHKASFSQTFQKWGWEGERFLMLPVVGPSDEVHAVGFGMDRAADPMSYNRDTRMISYGLTFNKDVETIDETLLQIESDSDPYSTIRTIWSYASLETAPDWSMHAPQDPSTLETLAVATLKLKSQNLINRMREGRVKIASTGEKLPFNFWLQDHKAPLVYVVPGLGSHRLSMQALNIVEGLYNKGYSVVSLTGLFHPEFIELASNRDVPGYALGDREDVYAALDAIDGWMEKKHGDQLGSRALLGCSMGAFQTLLIAAMQEERPMGSRHDGDRAGGKGVHFDRFIAVNPPVDLNYGMERLDSFHDAAAKWPAAVRQQRINNSIHKVAALMVGGLPKDGKVRIDGTESKFLIGLAFRMTLRNVIYNTQVRNDMGLLGSDLSSWRREPAYDEIMRISFDEYLHHFVLPYYRKQGIDEATFRQRGNLRSLTAKLAPRTDIRVITSRNDFLLSAGDVGWLQSTFGKRLTLLEKGGHLGAMANSAFHDKLGVFLEGLKAE